MALYLVQAASEADADLARARFHREGFSWAAFVWGWVWLLYRRLWLAFLVWAVLEVAFILAVLPHVSGFVAAACDCLARIYLGLEAQRLRVNGGWRRAGLMTVVQGASRDEAETSFFRAHRSPTPPPMESVA